MNETEKKLMKRMGEQAWERGKLQGNIIGLIHNYKNDGDVPEFVIEDLESVVNDE